MDEQSVEDSEFIPCKFPLCMICVSPTNSDLHDSEEKEGDLEVTISKETFLKGITILCNTLSLEDTFGKEEEWTKVLGTWGNFVGSVCCGRCSQLLRNLVELHDLIVRTEVKLKEHVNQVELSVVNSLGLAAEAEYSISTCLRFREEVLNSYQNRRTSRFPETTTPQSSKRNQNQLYRPRPLSARRRLESKLKVEALQRLPEVKLEKLELDHNVVVPVPVSRSFSENEDGSSDGIPSVMVEDDQDEEFRPYRHRLDRNSLLHNSIARKRGRPSTKPSFLKKRKAVPVPTRRPRGRPPKSKPFESIPKEKRPRGRPRREAVVTVMDLSVPEENNYNDYDPSAPSPPQESGSELQEGRKLGKPKRGRPKKTEEPPDNSLDDLQNNSSIDVEYEENNDFQPSSPSSENDSKITKRARGRPKTAKDDDDDKISSKGKRGRPKTSISGPGAGDARLTRIDDPYNDRRTCRKVDRLINDDSPHYLKPFLLVDPGAGILSYYNCKILMERARLICKHPECDFAFELEYFHSLFYGFRGMRYHVRMEHRRTTKKEGEIETENRGVYCCPYCDLNFERRFFMVQHIKTDHPNAEGFPSLCEVCGMPISHGELLKHLLTHKSERERNLAKKLIESYKSHPGKTKDPTMPLDLPCDKCDQIFEDYTRYRMHAPSHVPLEFRKQFQCDMCPEILGSLNGLRIHMKIVHFKHEQPHPFECNVCGQKFGKYQKEKYKVHLRIHTGELPFQCSLCGKGFRDKYRMKVHEKLHASTEIQCEFCPNVYKSRLYLRKHHHKHHPDLVRRPDKSLTDKYRHVQHLPEYHGPKLMFPCEPCQKVYVYKSQLIPHLRHAHKMFYPKSSDYPNMLTMEDNITVKNSRNRVAKTKSASSTSPSTSSCTTPSGEMGEYSNTILGHGSSSYFGFPFSR